MARQSLGGMLAPAPTKPNSPREEAVDPPPRKAGRPTTGSGGAGRAVTGPDDDAGPPAGEAPRYLTLQRKEARLTDEQLDELTLLTRRLNKRGRSKEERITDNTLIRVAVDLLLDRAADLDGTTEAELRKSVGL